MPVALPEGPRKKAFDAVTRALQNDPRLQNYLGESWKIADAKSANVTPDVRAMPCVGLRFQAVSLEPACAFPIPSDTYPGLTRMELRSRVRLLVDGWVPGGDQGELLKLADAIHAALFPPDPAVRGKLRERLWAASVNEWSLEREVLPGPDADYGDGFIHGQGSYLLTLVISQ